MNIDEMLEISDCPLCEGGALLCDVFGMWLSHGKY